MKTKIFLLMLAFLLVSTSVLAAGTIQGYVKNINGNPLGNVNVTVLISIGGFSNSTLSDNTTGAYNLTVQTTPAIYNLTANFTNYAPSFQQKLIQTGVTVQQNIILTPISGTIAVHVANNAGSNLANVYLNVYNSNNSLVAFGATNANGNASFTYMQNGTYNVTASLTNYYDNSSPAIVNLGNTTNVNINLFPSIGSVFGYVKDQNSNPIANAKVEIAGYPPATTDINGYYAISNIPPGSYAITESAVGFSIMSLNANIVAGSSTQVNFFYAPQPPSVGGGGGGGGSGAGESCNSKWSCTYWGECGSNGLQSRTCTDLNSCLIPHDKPNETQACTYTASNVNTPTTPEVKTSAVQNNVNKTQTSEAPWYTGAAVLNFVKSNITTTILVIIIVILFSAALYFYLKGR